MGFLDWPRERSPSPFIAWRLISYECVPIIGSETSSQNRLLTAYRNQKTCPIVFIPVHAAGFLTHKKPVRVLPLSLPNTKNASLVSFSIELTFTSKCRAWGEIRQFCKLDEQNQSLMRSAITQMNLSARVSSRTQVGAHDCRFSGERTNPGRTSGRGFAISSEVDDRINEKINFLIMKDLGSDPVAN